MHSLLVLTLFLLLMSLVYRWERTLAIRLGAGIEHPYIYICLLETTSPETIHGNVKEHSSSVISELCDITSPLSGGILE